MKPSRRNFLAAAGGIAAGAGLVAARTVPATAQVAPSLPEPNQQDQEPFYGTYQAGITTPMQSALYFASFDLAATKRSDLIGMLQAWTDAAARLTAGQPAEPGTQNLADPPLDTGEALGLNPQRLTLTFGFGPDMFAFRRFKCRQYNPAAGLQQRDRATHRRGLPCAGSGRRGRK